MSVSIGLPFTSLYVVREKYKPETRFIAVSILLIFLRNSFDCQNAFRFSFHSDVAEDCKEGNPFTSWAVGRDMF